jgi:ketosteroid isomerase-like protein
MTDQTTLSPTELLDLMHDAFNAGDMDRVAGLSAPTAVDYGAANGTVPGSPEHAAAWDRQRRAFRSSLADFETRVERSIENGDTVGQLLRVRGVMNGRPIEASGIHIVRVRDGKVAEHWGVFEGAAQEVASPSPTEVLHRATESFLAGFPAGGPRLVAPDAVDHSDPGDPVEAWEGRRRALRARMSDVSVTVEHSIESGDAVAQLVVTAGALDGRPFRIAGFHIVRVREGRIVEHWAVAEPFA